MGSVGSQILIDITAWHERAIITIITAITTVILRWVTLLHVHILDILVHATDTDAIGDLHMDEASVAPSGAP